MRYKVIWLCCIALFSSLLEPTSGRSEPPSLDPVAKAIEKVSGGQQMLKLPVRVVDAEGKPVAKVKITPWALRCSHGHGWWRKGDERAAVDPQEVHTRDDGTATVLYPRLRDVKEQIQTLAVSLNVDHPDYAYQNDLHIDVPLETAASYEIKLTRGVALEARPLMDGKPTNLENIYALWSDGRSWEPGAAPAKTAEGTLRFPAMAPGKNSVLLVKLEGERATHFSKITDFELKAGEPKKLDIELRPSLQIHGVLSANVPRPIKNGRLETSTLPPADASDGRVTWFSWSPIQADGTFVIDGWPTDERVQVVALCDGFMATSGKAPDVVRNPRAPHKDPFSRPQVFEANQQGSVELAMTELAHCAVTVIDEGGAAVAGMKVISGPNVGWWNIGSQIYCRPLVRSETMLKKQVDYADSADHVFPEPFQGMTDAKGRMTLELPAGREDLDVISDVYELPVFLGRREMRVELVRGKTTEVTLRLQPRGTEKLGEWDKLAGVVFGCSTREGRRICALPDVRKKMDEFEKRFREAKDQRDPQLLSEAYTAVADAFTNVGDQAEAAKWRQKAAEQAAKAAGKQQPASGK